MNEEQMDALTEALLEKEAWVIDFLPRQVGAERAGAFFAAENFFREPSRLRASYEKFASLAVKLSCYYDLALWADGAWSPSPAPEALREGILACAESGWRVILLPGEEALLTLGGGDLYMTLCHPSAALRETVGQLAAAEGLFLRRGAWEEPNHKNA